MKANLLIWALILELLAVTAYCDMYKWEDKNGVHFTDNAESIPKKNRSKAMAEAREDITGIKTSERNLASDSSIKPGKLDPAIKNRLNNEIIPDKQEQTLNLDRANIGTESHDYQIRHKKRRGRQIRGVEEAQRSAYENLTPERKAMIQAEERIRQNRQALDAGSTKQRQIRKPNR